MARRQKGGTTEVSVRGPSLVGLRKIEVLNGLELRILRQVAYRCRWTRYKRNEYVARRDEVNGEVHFVVSGLLRATADSGLSKRIFFRDIPAGDIFGESTAIDGQPQFADVMCAREALVASMSTESFRALIANYASVRERVLRRLTHSVRDLAERMLDLRTMSVAHRICGELLRLAKDATSSDRAILIASFPTHEELAAQVGTSREQVTRELSRLEREGVILRRGRSMELRDFGALQQVVKRSSENRDERPHSDGPVVESNPERSPRQVRALLVAELNSGGRLFETEEKRSIDEWNAYFTHVATEIIPNFEGRSFSDAVGQRFVADFPDCHSALNSTFALHDAIKNPGVYGHLGRAGLRIGVHLADVVVSPFQVSGKGVHVAADLAKLCNAGETVISVQVRDRLTSGLDVSLEDLGEQRLSSIDRPVRAFRTWPVSQRVPNALGNAAFAHARPSVAVVPFQLHSNDTRLQFAGDALADETIASLSRVADFFVVSRLSTMAFRHARLTARSIGEILGVQYVLSGTIQAVSGQVRLLAELSDARDGQVLWNERFQSAIGDVLAMQEHLARAVVKNVAPFIRDLELRRARLMNDDQREAYALTLLAVDLMHRMSKDDFLSARTALQRAITQDPLYAGPHAWLAKWHVLRVATGASESVVEDQQAAIREAEQALVCDSQDALALAVDGLVCGWSRNDLDRAQWRLGQALACNSNEPLAWLWHGIVHAWRGDGDEAVRSTDQALSLSPLDPMLYYFYSLASTANMVAGRYERAIDFALRSVRENRLHTPSLRTLAVSQVLAGRTHDARTTVTKLRSLEPDLTTTSFKARYPGRDSPQTTLFTEALLAAGLPR